MFWNMDSSIGVTMNRNGLRFCYFSLTAVLTWFERFKAVEPWIAGLTSSMSGLVHVRIY
jgi:hypothetical protein